jgi:UDP-glucose 4-epimerase
MNVLVTGAAGFLAPHVAAAFREAGHVCRLTDLRPGEGSTEIEVADLTRKDDVLRVTKGVDVVCHLGGVGDVYLAFEKPDEAARANVVGTATLLEACVRNGVHKVIYTSTWEVYGEPQYLPLDELHPCRPDHPYNITKLAGEHLAVSYDRLKGLPTVCLRLGTAYGRGMRPNSVFSIFITKALKQEPITIKGSGEQMRQFTHAKDIGQAFALAAGSKVHGEVFNIVSPEEVTIRQLAEMVAEALPTSLEFGEARPGDIASARVSSAKAERLLSWRPQVAFRDGLHDLIEWHQRNL